MKKIDTTYWKAFRVGDLFDIHPTKAYKLTNAQLLDGGKTPVVANSAYNNGIGGFSTLDATEKGNMITFSDTVDANTIFYQEDGFIGYPHVQGMYPIGEYKEKWTLYSLLFFASLFRKSAISKGFDYGNKFRRDIAIDIVLKLPVRDDEPNWQYMEDYMRGMENRVKDTITALNEVKSAPLKIDHSNWKEFTIDELFQVVKGKRLTKASMVAGDINYIGATAYNNGVSAKIGNTKYLHPARTITVCYNGSIGQTFYQEQPFWASDDVNVLYPKFKISRYIAHFICPVIYKLSLNYAYIDKWTADKMRTTKMKLPATPAGEPDWHYMEMYMRGVEAMVKEKLSVLIPHKPEVTINDAAVVNFNGANVTYIDNSKTFNVEK